LIVVEAVERFSSTPHPDPERPQPLGSEAGYTLVELVIALSILALVATVFLGGLATIIRGSRASDAQARVEAIQSAAADRVATVPFLACASPAAYEGFVQDATSTVAWPSSALTIVDIKYWNGVTFSAACSPTSVVNFVQLVTVKVTSPDGSYSRSMEVAKNDVVPNQK
jgi:prepilin-type N-terminal cleavage/methylation domain-containing protein